MNLVKTLGWVVIVVGVLGFVPGITSDGMLLGIFEANTITSLVYIILGVLAVMMGKKDAKTWGMIVGAVYLLVGILGFVMAGDVLGIIASNTATDVLHAVLGLAFLWGGMKAGKGAGAAAM